MTELKTVDITPSPRILRVLGEIPFQTWQCFAELMDNSIDALLKMDDVLDRQKAVWVKWSSRTVTEKERTIEIEDNAEGMTLEQMQNSVRAGYSNNNPIGNLGLFGMGFNIATARLGSKTELWSTTQESEYWYGIEISFDKLVKGNAFQAPVLSKKKIPGEDCSGTKIIVSELKTGASTSLYQQEREIRRTLENVYSPLLSEKSIDLYIQGKILHPRKPCVWSEQRSVSYKQQSVPAVIRIDKNLGQALFDLERNTYLSWDEAEEYKDLHEEQLPEHICMRQRRLHGWLGIQRYFDPNDYGIDFIRNGRKILMREKSLFFFDNPLTGDSIIQYPVELGTTVGGRIIGQLHVDYLLPTYQKNDFDRYDNTWNETIGAICGDGPFLPKQRKALGYDEVPDSPLGILVNAFRRTDPGTKNLALPKSLAKEYYSEFLNGNADYESDEKWWRAAQECDQERQSGNNPPANTGDTPSDDIDSFLDGEDAVKGPSQESDKEPEQPEIITSTIEDLLDYSTPSEILSKKYSISGANPLSVRAYELKGGEVKSDGKKTPCAFFGKGIECSFFYDPRHEALRQFPITPLQLLLLCLAERFKMRDGFTNLAEVYSLLVKTYMRDERVDPTYLKERAEGFFTNIRGPLRELLEPISDQVVQCIHESSGEVEEAFKQATAAGVSFDRIKKDASTAYEIIDFIPDRTVLRLIDRFPERLFDGHLFNASYGEIQLDDKQMEERLRVEVKDRIVSYVKDLLYLSSTHSSSVTKNDLSRVALSLEALDGKLVSE